MAMTQDELKTLVGRAALDYVKPGSIVGVGTGSTVDKFIDALKHVERAAFTRGRKETSGEHCWQVALVAASVPRRRRPQGWWLS